MVNTKMKKYVFYAIMKWYHELISKHLEKTQDDLLACSRLVSASVPDVLVVSNIRAQNKIVARNTKIMEQQHEKNLLRLEMFKKMLNTSTFYLECSIMMLEYPSTLSLLQAWQLAKKYKMIENEKNSKLDKYYIIDQQLYECVNSTQSIWKHCDDLHKKDMLDENKEKCANLAFVEWQNAVQKYKEWIKSNQTI
jgi:hypothetical protein